MKKKRIGRVSKGEDVIVKILPEDLQDLFDKMCESADDARRAEEALTEDNSDENGKQRVIASYEAIRNKMNFWQGVHERYGHWTANLGVRDGYALVTFEEDKGKSDIPDFIKKILKDMQE